MVAAYPAGVLNTHRPFALLALGLVWAAAASGAVAVIVATFVFIRDWPRYLTIGNILMTLAAAIPPAIIVAIAWVLKYGHFHI